MHQNLINLFFLCWKLFLKKGLPEWWHHRAIPISQSPSCCLHLAISTSLSPPRCLPLTVPTSLSPPRCLSRCLPLAVSLSLSPSRCLHFGVSLAVSTSQFLFFMIIIACFLLYPKRNCSNLPFGKWMVICRLKNCRFPSFHQKLCRFRFLNLKNYFF